MKVIDFMKDNIGKPVKLGFRSTFVYCDIVSEDIAVELANLSARWLAHEMDRLHDGIEAHDCLVALGVNKFADREVARWISRHMSLDNPDPVCPRGMIKQFKTSYYNEIKRINKDVATYSKAITSFKPFGECEIKEVYTSTADFKTLIVIGKGNRYML